MRQQQYTAGQIIAGQILFAALVGSAMWVGSAATEYVGTKIGEAIARKWGRK